MPHRIDIDSIHRDVFMLLNLCYAGDEFSQRHKLDPMSDSREVGYGYYFGWLKQQLSEKLIACSIKTRITLDILRIECDEVDLVQEDKEICKRHNIGTLKGDAANLSIREVCNKVIHADSVSPNVVSYDGNCERWNGFVTLRGVKGKARWQLDLDLAAFCLALNEMLAFSEENCDWHRVYKYD
jgi:hypothetical protein